MKSLASPALLVAIVTLVLLSVTASCKRASPTGEPSVEGFAGVSSPKWELRDLEGKVVKSSDFEGKVILLNFWASWCGPCRMEIPSLIELQRRRAENGLVVLGVSIDEGGPSAVRSLVKQLGINYPILFASDAVVRTFGGIESIPTTFVIDRAGRIVGKHVGFSDKATLEAIVNPLLAP